MFFIFWVSFQVCDIIAGFFFALGVESTVSFDEGLLIRRKHWRVFLRGFRLFLQETLYT